MKVKMKTEVDVVLFFRKHGYIARKQKKDYFYYDDYGNTYSKFFDSIIRCVYCGDEKNVYVIDVDICKNQNGLYWSRIEFECENCGKFWVTEHNNFYLEKEDIK